MSADIEIAVVGAGVVGLAIAKSLAERGHDVMVLERCERIGNETSSRNSEVIHAGIYYPKDSVRARLCVEGKKLMYRFAEENGVAHKRCGKLVVATSEAEVPALDKLIAHAAACGVGDLVKLNRDEARVMEPEAACVAAALSPSTGIVDSHTLMVALEGHITTHGGQVVLNTAVSGLARDKQTGLFRISTVSGGEESEFTARQLILAPGLEATKLARMLFPDDSEYVPPETYPVKGHYFTLSSKAPFERLIYPMPGRGWLGLHLTLDIAGQAKFGPDIDWNAKSDYSFEDEDGSRLAKFEGAIRRYWPGLPENSLNQGYVGLRPKIHKQDEPPGDFTIHGDDVHGVPGLVALYGIESPGLTSSMAIGEHVADLASQS